MLPGWPGPLDRARIFITSVSESRASNGPKALVSCAMHVTSGPFTAGFCARAATPCKIFTAADTAMRDFAMSPSGDCGLIIGAADGAFAFGDGAEGI